MFKRYFSERKKPKAALVQNSFLTPLNVSDIFDELPDQFYDLRNDLSAREIFREMALFQFWCAMRKSYGPVSELDF